MFMAPQVITLADKLAAFEEAWQPKIVAELNDYHVKLAKFDGEFVWHKHEETDELFLVVAGEMVIHFRDGEARVRTGEMIVVPRGVEHKPAAEDVCHVLLLEPAGTVNTGDHGGERTAPADVWI
jgi:mannose-6-phosphate isomerase-like protein (cupin superfamily)